MRALLLLLVACGGSKGGVDCDTVLKDPGTALSKLAEGEKDGGAVFAKLEQCYAPTGDTCERAAVGGRMMPSMAVSDGSAGDVAIRDASWKQYAADCRTLSPADQQCLLLSYAVGHPNCSAVQAKFRADHPPK